MKTLTIRGLPDDVHERLKQRARLNRRSLNQELIAELVEVLKDDVGGGEVLSACEHFRSGLKNPQSAEMIRAAINEGRKA